MKRQLLVICFLLGTKLYSLDITVVGAGYVGLVTAASFAHAGHRVQVVENDESKMTTLRAGKIPFFEKGLAELVEEGVQAERLSFVSSVALALEKKAEVIFCCVGTPPRADGTVEMSYVWQVSDEISQSLREPCILVMKSTVPVGTAASLNKRMGAAFLKRGCQPMLCIASNPEFLQEGSAVENFLHPDRVLIGTDSERAKNLLEELYRPFVQKEDQLISMSPASAELAKYAANTMLATRVSFMNQLARLAQVTGADITDIARVMGADERIGPYFLRAGLGYGGSCFPKDIKALVSIGKEHGVAMSLIDEVDVINNEQRAWFIEQIIGYYGNELKNKTIGIWGLSFKPHTDDIRYAPSQEVIESLCKIGARVVVYDPVASTHIEKLFGDAIIYARTQEHVLSQADALVLLTEWPTFKQVDPKAFGALHDRVVFDGPNCFEHHAMSQAGITYISVGRCYLPPEDAQ